MPDFRSVLCPVDFSDASRGALRYAAAVANHLQAELTVLTVTDPLLTEAAELSGALDDLPEAINKELHRFCAKTFETGVAPASVRYELTTGKPAVETLRVAKSMPAALIVMSTHGLTGMRKLFFGSTTERVLRETTVPVLLTPAHDHGPSRIEDVKKAVKRILVPVDLEPGDARACDGVRQGRGGARGAGAPLLRRRAGALRRVRVAAPAEPRGRAATSAPRRRSASSPRACSPRCAPRRSSPTAIRPRKSPSSRATATPA